MTTPSATGSNLAEPRTIWVTRTEPGASRTAAGVEALGFQSLIAPLLTVSPTGAALALQPFEALALTSSQAIAHLGADVSRQVRVFAVGAATAKAARAAGFKDVISADGDVAALVELILKERPPAVVHAAAAQTAGDLVQRLAEADMSARRVVVYRAAPAEGLPEAVLQGFETRAIAAILIHSPRAGRIASALLADAGVDPRIAPVLGLSPACVGQLKRRGFVTAAAAEPTEAALLALLAKTATI